MHVRVEKRSDDTAYRGPGSLSAARVGRVDELAGVLALLNRGSSAADAGERIDRIAVLERVQAAAAAEQLREISLFAEACDADSPRRSALSGRRVGDGIADQVGLACKISPASAARRLTQARALTGQLPQAMTRLAAGDVSLWVATLMVRETSALSPEHQRAVDTLLADLIPGLNAHQVEAAARRAAIRMEPDSVLRRAGTARNDRRVSIRPAPDTMAILSAYLPCEDGVAAWASLTQEAATLRSGGDERSRQQIMADLLTDRLTGRSTSAPPHVEIGLTMTTDSLLDLDPDHTPAHLHGYGPIPAHLARNLVGIHGHQPAIGSTDQAGRADQAGQAKVFVRRLFTDPVDHTVTTIDTQKRRFPRSLADLIAYRDQTCRVPFCAAPIRHLDHINPHGHGGPTNANNGRGVCERHNYTKELPGWHTRVQGTHPHTTVVTTPTGHRYQSTAPPALGPGSAPP